MSRPRLLLIDPDDTRRERFQAYLISQFEVVATPVAARSHERFTALKPDAVLAHAKQPGSSGPRICRELRELSGGEDCLMVVYGHLVGPRKTPVQCEQMRVECRLDIWLTREVDAIDLEKVLGLKLLAPEEAPRVAAPPATRRQEAQKLEFISAHRDETGDETSWGTAATNNEDRGSFLAAMASRYRPMIEKLPEDQDVTWGQIMRARANLHNLKVMLENPVTPLIQELPDDRPPTAAEILRARVTLRNLRIILRRRLPGAPADDQEPATEEVPRG